MTPRRILSLCALGCALLLFLAPRPGRDDPAVTGATPYRAALGGEHTDDGEPGEATSGAMGALRWLAVQRAYPADRYPSRGWLEAHAAAKSLPHPAEKAFPWRPLGPLNIGGRTLALAINPVNPRTVWAGSASGGLWRSFTGGEGTQAWHRVPTRHPVLAVSCIAIAPDDTNLMYIGTGEVYSHDDTQGGLSDRLTRGSFGIGVLKSVDGGRTWQASLDWSLEQGRGVQTLALDPTDPEVVWACTSEGVYKTEDGGGVWTPVHDVVMATDIVIHRTHPDSVIVACGNLNSLNNGLYRTLDGGATWHELTQIGILPTNYQGKALLAGSRSDPDLVMASIGNGGLGNYDTWLVRTANFGDYWTRASAVDYSQWQGWFSHDVAIHPTSTNIVITAGIDILKSIYSGQALSGRSDWRLSWFGKVPIGGPEGPPRYSHADHHDIVWHPTDPNTVYFANDGGIFRSRDLCETFEGLNGGYQTTQFYAGFSSSARDADLALGGLQDNYTAIYDGGGAWIRAVGGDGAWTAIDPGDDARLYASAQYLNLFRSADAGSTWTDITPNPMIGQPGFVAPYALAGPLANRRLYAGTNHVLRSDDGGTIWYDTNGGHALSDNPALSLAVAPADPDVVLVTTAPLYGRAGVFRTDDGGLSWADVTGPLPDRYPVGLCLDPLDPLVAWVTFSGFGVSHLWRTGDGGLTWEDRGGLLPDVPTTAVLVDPGDVDDVYVGTDLGVFASQDGGATWQWFSEGLIDAAMCMDLSISADDRLRVSTYGNGVWERPLLRILPTAVEQTPAATRLESPAPNPFNPSTELAFTLAGAGFVRLEVLDLRGRVVRALRAEPFAAGRHVVRWDGRDDDGRAVASGAYLARLTADGGTESVKLTLAR